MAQSNDPMARVQAALEKIADRLPELPKPVLAAIGAADLAGRQLSDLLNSLADKAGIKSPYSPGRDQVVDEPHGAANDLPGRVQQLATNMPDRAQELVADLPSRAKELADQLEQFATRLPGRVQKFTDELPGKAKEFSEQMQPDQLKQSADAYRQLIGSVLSTLAGRGEKAWDDIRNTGPVPGSVVDAGSAKAADSAPKSAAKPASKKAPKVAEKPAAATSTPRPARRKPTPKTSTEKSSTEKSSTEKSSTGKPAADSKGVTKAAAAKAARPTAVSGPRPPRPRRGTFPSASS